ncbi:MAG: diaminopimelate epimerase [Ardenticatenaceae bacterium]|nr:diaminopimelate epimerase [Anaerolineales bacterium]MCB8941877.1 diaminopimelate epimerase [Ardenticatenaceae bacterium]MCB8972991.1 diaminopimelate epimerase [Ardenticatenaceae bacterium]
MKFSKYHGLGNIYIVLEPELQATLITRAMIQTICDPHFGVGSDGILWGPLASETCDFGVRIYNPDGSDAEKSGNGLRIFARYLLDTGRVGHEAFDVETLGGPVTCTIAADLRTIRAEMGQVRFCSEEIPVTGPPRDVLNEEMEVGDRTFRFCAATLGNPHCVVLLDEPPTAELAQRYGPFIEHSPLFPRRTNVQFLYVRDRQNIQIEIWERGASYTLASGSSSTAATAVAHRLGLCDNAVTVHMPGGTLSVALDENFYGTLIGPVTKICDGEIAPEMFGRKVEIGD